MGFPALRFFNVTWKKNTKNRVLEERSFGKRSGHRKFSSTIGQRTSEGTRPLHSFIPSFSSRKERLRQKRASPPFYSELCGKEHEKTQAKSAGWCVLLEKREIMGVGRIFRTTMEKVPRENGVGLLKRKPRLMF